MNKLNFYQRARMSVFFHNSNPKALLRISGEDAEDYLQSNRLDQMIDVLSSLNVEEQLFFLGQKAAKISEECEQLKLESTDGRLQSQASRSAKQLEESAV